MREVPFILDNGQQAKVDGEPVSWYGENLYAGDVVELKDNRKVRIIRREFDRFANVSYVVEAVY